MFIFAMEGGKEIEFLLLFYKRTTWKILKANYLAYVNIPSAFFADAKQHSLTGCKKNTDFSTLARKNSACYSSAAHRSTVQLAFKLNYLFN